MIVLAGCWAGAFADWDCISHESFVRCTGSASKISKSGDIDSIVIDSFFRITLDLAGIPLQPIFSNNTNPFYFSYVYDVNLGWYNCVGASCHAAVTQPHEIGYTANRYTIFNALTDPSCRRYALLCNQGTIADFNVTVFPGCLNCEYTLKMIAAP